MMMRRIFLGLGVLIAVGTFGACGGSSTDGGGGNQAAQPTGSPEQTGATCAVADDCFPKVDRTQLAGDPLCLDRVRGGYCTHLCQTDADCCAIDGECETNLKQVCAPFESTGQMMCFLSCESGDLQPDPSAPNDPVDADGYCQWAASSDFGCRSTGGGRDNRKVCTPVDCGVGAACASDVDCATGLTCSLDFAGGYCGADTCTADADCPPNSRCAAGANGGGYCAKSCAADTDCSVCRYAAPLGCAAEVQLVDGTSAPLCAPAAR